MKFVGLLIKSWVYNKTLFYLVKIRGQNVPVVISARDANSVSLRKDGSISGNMDNNKFKISRGRSKQYFGEKKTMDEGDQRPLYSPDGGIAQFDEYDPYDDDSFLDSPDDDIVLIGSGGPPGLGGSEIPDDPLPDGGGMGTLQPPPPPPTIPPLPTGDEIPYESGEYYG